jgi:cell division protein FtsX
VRIVIVSQINNDTYHDDLINRATIITRVLQERRIARHVAVLSTTTSSIIINNTTKYALFVAHKKEIGIE